MSRAAIESAAENLSDGVVAPALWFMVAGLPGMAAYKAVNTADSMIGHRTPRHEAFGWAAARVDDALNWIPARATALGLAARLGRRCANGPRSRRTRDATARPTRAGPRRRRRARFGVALSGPRRYGGRVADEPFVNPAGRHDANA